MLEIGQDWKVAALIASMCVHFFLEEKMQEKIIKELLILSKKAFSKDEVPIAAIIAKDNKIIAKAYNTRNKSKITIDHAEIKAIIKANKILKRWILDDCDIYVTLKPCDMCCCAIKEARIKNIFYLLDTEYQSSLSKNININKLNFVNKEEEYKKILSTFFLNKR